MRNFPDYDGPMATWPRVELIPWVRETLAELHPAWLLSVATNAAESEEADIWAALHRIGIGQFFDKIYCFRKVGFKKPAVEFFEYILKDLEFEPDQVIMVGDDFEIDIQGANQVGIRAVWFNEGSEETTEGFLYRSIHDFRSLPGEIQALQRDRG